MGDEIEDYGILRLRMTFRFHAIAAMDKNPTSGIEFVAGGFRTRQMDQGGFMNGRLHLTQHARS